MVIWKQDRWTKSALKLPKVLFRGGAVYLDGEIYVFGGCWTAKELYKLDNKTLKWIRLADMNEGRAGIINSSVEWNGSIWVFGGWDIVSSFLKSVERYDPKENKWIEMP